MRRRTEFMIVSGLHTIGMTSAGCRRNSEYYVTMLANLWPFVIGWVEGRDISCAARF